MDKPIENSLKKYKLTLSYDGTRYCGWQTQPHLPSIQTTLQDALTRVLREKITVVASGRTDAGVHALAQTAHFKTTLHLPIAKIHYAVNSVLPEDIAIQSFEEVGLKFHAQKDALKKRYLYFIFNSRHRHPFLEKYSWQIPYPLNWPAINVAFSLLEGTHDFASFQTVGTPVLSTVRTLFKARRETASPLIENNCTYFPFIAHPNLSALVFEGDGFLKQMVRNLVGTLIQVGKGFIAPTDITKILAAKDRRKAGMAAPARGLFLDQVFYPS